MRLLGTAVGVSLLMACQPDLPQEHRGTHDSGPSGGTGVATSPEEGVTPRFRAADDIPEGRLLKHTIFDETPDAARRGRVTLHALIEARADRSDVRRTLEEIVQERTRSDPSVTAIRVIAYIGEASGGHEVDLVPGAWAEWVPLEGWDRTVSQSRSSTHRFYFYFGAPPPW